MRKLLLILSLNLFFIWNCFSQFGIINDPDGYTNVRKESNSKSEIVSKIYEYELFWTDAEHESENSWKYIWFFEPIDRLLKEKPELNRKNLPLTDNRMERQGFIHESRIQNLKDISVQFETEIQANTLKAWNNSFSFVLKKVPFEESKHKIGKNKQGFVSTINNKEPFGIDGFLPRNEIEQISLNLGGNEIAIPKESYSDLFEPNFKSLEIFKKNNVFYISMWNSDGAGAYVIVWLIQDEKYWQRYVLRLF